jgi:branched-chain amino acid transport system ATP-binding protein
MTTQPLLSIRHLSVHFGGVNALDNLSFDIPSGSICSLIGPNGAGKTTCFNCITGFYKPDSGEILFEGENLAGLPSHKIAQKGIGRTYQNIRTYSQLTVLENILAGQHIMMKTNLFDAAFHTRRYITESKEALEKARQIQEMVGLAGIGDQLARNLPYGAQRRLEIGRAIASNPRLVLLDEPSAGMNPTETRDLANLIRKLRDSLALTVLIIEHDMSLIMSISEQVTVLDFGQKISEGKPAEVQRDSRVINAYLGNSSLQLQPA